MRRVSLLFPVLVLLCATASGGVIQSEVRCSLTGFNSTSGTDACGLFLPGVTELSGNGVSLARAYGSEFEGTAFVRVVGAAPAIGQSYFASATALFDSTTSVLTEGPERDGYAYLQVIGSSQAIDAVVGGSVLFGGYEWTIGRNQYYAMGSMPSPPGYMYPVTLGQALPVQISLYASGSSDPNFGSSDYGAVVTARVMFQFFEADRTTPVGLLTDLSVPEPGSFVLAATALLIVLGSARRLRRT